MCFSYWTDRLDAACMESQTAFNYCLKTQWRLLLKHCSNSHEDRNKIQIGVLGCIWLTGSFDSLRKDSVLHKIKWHTCECLTAHGRRYSLPGSRTTRCYRPWSKTGTATREWLLQLVATTTGCLQNPASPTSPRDLNQREWKWEDRERSQCSETK